MLNAKIYPLSPKNFVDKPLSLTIYTTLVEFSTLNPSIRVAFMGAEALLGKYKLTNSSQADIVRNMFHKYSVMHAIFEMHRVSS